MTSSLLSLRALRAALLVATAGLVLACSTEQQQKKSNDGKTPKATSDQTAKTRSAPKKTVASDEGSDGSTKDDAKASSSRADKDKDSTSSSDDQSTASASPSPTSTATPVSNGLGSTGLLAGLSGGSSGTSSALSFLTLAASFLGPLLGLGGGGLAGVIPGSTLLSPGLGGISGLGGLGSLGSLGTSPLTTGSPATTNPYLSGKPIY